jgi:cyclopropane-fatty-acyl-phospholipid synthase
MSTLQPARTAPERPECSERSAGRATSGGGRPLDRLARRVVLRLLARTRGGELLLVEDSRVMSFGERLPERPLSAVLSVRSPGFYRQLLRGSVGLGEAYVEGLWDCEDLVALTRIAALNVGALDKLRRMFAPMLIPVQRWARWLGRNTPGRARKRIAAHYDLGNELFSQFLDPTMMYSCAVFESPGASLEEASLAKLDGVCAKLDLGPEDHVLEIGTGWGGFALHAAGQYGCRVTTTTISAEQHAYARERVREAGLEDLVTVLLEDYRDLRGSYDKLISIEMIEAVGWQYFPTFFRRCSELVKDDGAMLLQAIVIEDRAYEVEKAGRSFINTHIFPGGCLPSVEVIGRTVARVTDFRQVQLEDITAHYAITLQRWRERFLAATDRLSELGYDERFRRMWELYLSYCEGGFRERRIRDVQLLLAKPRFR